MSSYALSSEQCQRFDEDGFLTIPGLLSGEEIDPLVERLGAEPDLFCKVGALDWVFWTDPKDDLVGTLPRPPASWTRPRLSSGSLVITGIPSWYESLRDAMRSWIGIKTLAPGTRTVA